MEWQLWQLMGLIINNLQIIRSFDYGNTSLTIKNALDVSKPLTSASFSYFVQGQVLRGEQMQGRL